MSLARLVAGSVVAVDFAVAVVAESGPFVEHLEFLATLADRALVLTETGFDLELELLALALALELGARVGS